ncbi:MAG: tetratricopeptide repeat protein, partial [Pirellulaceae bacterium]|nr:tetratricopeptide repeat protein [Pirellulaceae bacterium]
QSAQAARDVSVSLNKLADFLASRGQPGDATQALEHYQRSLEVSEQLLRDNPQSAQAQRDVLVSLERLAMAVAAETDGHERALELQLRSLEIALHLREANPSSWFFQRTAAVSFMLTSNRAQATGDQQLTSSWPLNAWPVVSRCCTLWSRTALNWIHRCTSCTNSSGRCSPRKMKREATPDTRVVVERNMGPGETGG